MRHSVPCQASPEADYEVSQPETKTDAAHLRPRRPQKRRDRTAEVVRAACRVISRDGSQGLKMEAVAQEAGVSKALVHYYFPTRSQLLAAAYAYAEDRALARARSEIADVSPAARRVERLFELYLDDESTIREEWILWSQLSSGALFDDELMPSVNATYRNWVDWIVALVEQGLSDGSIAPAASAQRTGMALTAVVEGLSSLLLLKLLSRDEALELLSSFLGQLGVSSVASQSASRTEPTPCDRRAQPLVDRLLDTAWHAVDGLESAVPMADSKREAIVRAQQALVDARADGRR